MLPSMKFTEIAVNVDVDSVGKDKVFIYISIPFSNRCHQIVVLAVFVS